jgi:hypothetical protein
MHIRADGLQCLRTEFGMRMNSMGIQSYAYAAFGADDRPQACLPVHTGMLSETYIRTSHAGYTGTNDETIVFYTNFENTEIQHGSAHLRSGYRRRRRSLRFDRSLLWRTPRFRA